MVKTYTVKFRVTKNGDDFEKQTVVNVDVPEFNASSFPKQTDLRKLISEHDSAVLNAVSNAVNQSLPANENLLSIEGFYE